MPPTTAVEPAVLLPALQALADENRLRIVDALRDGERCVCVLQDQVGVSQSLLSHHLRVLRGAGLVVDRKEGRWVHYSLAVGALHDVERFLGGLTAAAGDASDAIACCP